MEENVKLSIIIPVYNSEKFIGACVESVLDQAFNDYEIILVDDGSIDDSLDICQQYSRSHSHIRVIHESNGGASKARNTGIEYAKGKYIYFVDSDDIMCPEVLQKLSKTFDHEFDMIFGNFISWNYLNSKKKIWDNITEIGITEKDDIISLCEKYARKNAQIPWNPYQAFYKRSILEKNDLKFDERLTVGEDCDFFFKYIKYVKSFKIENLGLVQYRIDSNSNSLIRNFNYENIMSQLKVFVKLYNEADCFNDKKLMKKYFATRFTNVVILIGEMNDKKEKNVCIDFAKKYADLIYQSDHAIKYKILQRLNCIFGLRIAISMTSSIRHIVINRREK